MLASIVAQIVNKVTSLNMMIPIYAAGPRPGSIQSTTYVAVLYCCNAALGRNQAVMELGRDTRPICSRVTGDSASAPTHTMVIAVMPS